MCFSHILTHPKVRIWVVNGTNNVPAHITKLVLYRFGEKYDSNSYGYGPKRDSPCLAKVNGCEAIAYDLRIDGELSTAGDTIGIHSVSFVNDTQAPACYSVYIETSK